MSKKIKVISDPTLATSHADGAHVTVIQPVLHDPYGVLNIPRPEYYLMHAKAALVALEKMKVLEVQVLELPIAETNSRMIDNELSENIYITGTRLVTDIVLAFEHITLAIEGVTKRPFLKADINTRLVRASKFIGFNEIPSGASYQSFCDIVNIRHAIMHPAEDNVYASQNWSKVPVAWIISGKCIRQSEICLQLLNRFVGYWANKVREYTKSQTLSVIRGIKFEHQVKKS